MVLASRNTKELLRDKLNLAFGLGFPVIILLLLNIIQRNIPEMPNVENSPAVMFELTNLTPGIAVFGLSFISLFSGMLISKDRTGSFMLRLFTSPLTSADFILGYALPLVPISAIQLLTCYTFAVILGMKISLNILLAVVVTLPAALLYIGIGLLCGCLLNDKQVGGICGAMLTNLTAWLSGAWFPISSLGKAISGFANALPFIHAVEAGRAAVDGRYSDILPDMLIVLGWAVVVFVAAVLIFMRKMNDNDK